MRENVTDSQYAGGGLGMQVLNPPH